MNRQTIAGILLAAGCPALLAASTLTSRVECRVDTQAATITPIQYRPEAYPLLLMLGIGQGLAAWQLFKGDKRRQVTEAAAMAALPEGLGEALQLPVIAKQPEPVMAAPQIPQVEPLQIRAKLEATAKSKIPAEFQWYRDFWGYPTVLIYGAQGAGKTSFTSGLIRCRLKLGHEVKVFDPHASATDWKGLPIIGKGMNYKAIDRALQAFDSEVKNLYEQRGDDESFDAIHSQSPKTVVIEEFTNWSDRCEHSSLFFKCCLSDIRKIYRHAIFVAHDRTLTALGGAKGVKGAQNNGMLELELLTQIDPETGEAVPAFKGRLKYPGKDPIDVEIAPWMLVAPDFAGVAQPKSISEPAETSETESEQEVQSDKVIPISRFVSSPETPEIDPERVKRVVEMKRSGLSQTQILAIEWQVKPGDNQPYRQAVAEFKTIFQLHGEQA